MNELSHDHVSEAAGQAPARPVLTDGDWVRLQGICGG